MQFEDKRHLNIADDAEDFHYVDKKKEALGCLGMIGEETLGCIIQAAIPIGILFLLAAIFGAL